MWLVAAGRVALPRKEQSQQSNLLTALRCVSHPSGAYLSVISADRAQTQVVFLSAIVITL